MSACDTLSYRLVERDRSYGDDDRCSSFRRIDEGATRAASAAIHIYTIGFAALEASRARSQNTNPTHTETETQLATLTTPHQFRVGLAFLIDGIERRCSSLTSP